MNKHLKKNDRLGMFIPVPFNLLTSSLSSTTLLIYGCILSRAIFSQKNGWYDQNGDVYVRYTAPQLSKDTGKGISTVKASIKELEDVGLIRRKRWDLTTTNIYVRVPEECIVSQNFDNPSQKSNPNKPVSYAKGSQEVGSFVAEKSDPSKYIRVNKELNKRYIVREGESF